MFAPLHFAPILMDRVWGGTKLASYIKEPVPEAGTIGEAWLISDHPSAESVVDGGAHEGRTLHELVSENPGAILGRLAKLTHHRRFPLLLKFLDSGAPLSVQVHPDDACAEGLAESDGGKTEMWHVVQADVGSKLVCGLDTTLDADEFRTAVERGDIENAITRFETAPGDSVLVPAGTVHAIGGGILLAEIQQNSDLTYRIYDYNRPGPDGKLRALHIEKAAKAIHFGSLHGGKSDALERQAADATRCSVLAACRHFAAERWDIDGVYRRDTLGDSFHIVLLIKGGGRVTTDSGSLDLREGQAALIPANSGRYSIESTGEALVYYVPNLSRDIVEPLVAAGHHPEAVVRLGGDPSTSDLAGLVK